MKKDKIGALFGFGLVLAGLTGCMSTEIMYEGKLQPIQTVEEILSNKLEVENPDLDINVNITEETDLDQRLAIYRRFANCDYSFRLCDYEDEKYQIKNAMFPHGAFYWLAIYVNT